MNRILQQAGNWKESLPISYICYLKPKPNKMKYVYLDTNIYEENNFLNGTLINAFIETIRENNITILLPEIALKEIHKRFSSRLKESINYINSHGKIAVLRNFSHLNNRFEQIEFDDLLNSFKKEFQSLIEEGIVKVIPSKHLDINLVFDQYCYAKAPFNEKQGKKAEFPDGLIINILENYLKSIRRKCDFITSDKDFNNYKSKNIEFYNSLGEYQNDILLKYLEKNKQSLRFKELNKYLYREDDSLSNQIFDWLTKQIHDLSLFINHPNISELSNISTASEAIKYSDLHLVDFKIDKIITSMNIQYEVELILTFRSEYGFIKDFQQETNYEIDHQQYSKKIQFPIELSIEFNKNKIKSIELLSINNRLDLKPFKLW